MESFFSPFLFPSKNLCCALPNGTLSSACQAGCSLCTPAALQARIFPEVLAVERDSFFIASTSEACTVLNATVPQRIKRIDLFKRTDHGPSTVPNLLVNRKLRSVECTIVSTYVTMVKMYNEHEVSVVIVIQANNIASCRAALCYIVIVDTKARRGVFL